MILVMGFLYATPLPFNSCCLSVEIEGEIAVKHRIAALTAVTLSLLAGSISAGASENDRTMVSNTPLSTSGKISTDNSAKALNQTQGSASVQVKVTIKPKPKPTAK